ncbi:MAG: hypothetical protein OEY16_04500 [Alphaproteobacteria bacterium]|nr:hypothetical protein [Alphaproteobacteria bacterium]
MRSFLSFMVLIISGASLLQGSPASGADFPVAEGSGMQNRPTIAYDPNGDRFFMAWYDWRNRETTGFDIYGRIVDGSGKPITGDIPITRAKRSQGNPSIAFDTVNDRILVLWSDWRDAADVDSDIYGRLFNRDGTPYGEEFRVAAQRGVAQKTANLAFDPTRQRFLVVWKDSRHPKFDKIYGRFIGADGVPQGEEFPLALEGNAQDSPSVLFDPRKDQFLVAWRDVNSVDIDKWEKSVIGTFVQAERGPSGKSFLIAYEKTGCTPLSLKSASFSPKDNYYFIAWSSGRNYHDTMPLSERRDLRFGYDDRPTGLDVYGAFISVDDGSVKGEEFKIASEIDYQEMPSVAYDPNKDRFLVVWYDLRRPPTNLNNDIYGRFITPKGKMSDEFLISDELATGPRQLPTVAFSPRSNAFLVLWEDGRDGRGPKTRIYGRAVR